MSNRIRLADPIERLDLSSSFAKFKFKRETKLRKKTNSPVEFGERNL
jgi:hypothetical protein